MIDHTGIGVSDIGRAGAFNDVARGALGLHRASPDQDPRELRSRRYRSTRRLSGWTAFARTA
jgi:hypothetical protein